MIKFKNTLKIFLPLVLFLSFGCSLKNDVRKDTNSEQPANTSSYTVSHNLNDLEEIYDNMDYTKVIDKYAHYIPSSASITRFRYYVIFSMLDENSTYDIIDKNIRQTVDAMTNNYLSDFPDSVIPVFLFSDFDEYKEFSINTFKIDENDLSPFGYYKIPKNAIVIKFYKWKGSVSHEITHSLIQFDFPDMPSWFNEGLASLHEKYIYKDGQMLGDFSWRIVALRHALEHNTYTALQKLMETNDEELYDSGRTSYYYAQARYLLMMLQKQGLLKKYYKLFRETYNEDNTGISQLEKVTGEPLEKIDKELIDYINSFELEW
jgi:hypothetical protein